MLRFCLGLLVAPLMVACSGGDGEDAGLSAAQTRTLTCARVVTVDLVRLLDRLEAALLAATGEPQDGVTVLPSQDMGDPAFTYTYVIEFDGDNDGTDDTVVSGKITFPQDPVDGIPGATDIPLSYTMAPLGANGPLAGAGNLSLFFESGAQAIITGGGTLDDDATGCSGTLGFDTDDGVRVAFSQTIATAAQLTANINGLTLWGKLGVDLATDAEDRFVGTQQMSSTSQNTTVDGNLNGSNFRYTFSIYPDAETIEELTDCIQGLVPIYADMTGIFLALSDVIDNAGGDLSSVPTTPGWTIELTSNVNVANYALDLTRFGGLLDGGRIDGQVRVSRVGFRLAVLWSWRLNGRIGAEVITGQSALFFRAQYDNAGNITSIGAGSLARDDCLGAFEIPEDDPIQQPYEGGSITFGATTGIHIIDAEFAVGLGGGISRRVKIDDIPAPERILIQFVAGR